MLSMKKYMKALKNMGFSQESTAELFDVSTTTINNWINDRKECRASESELFTGTDKCQLKSNLDKDRFILDFIGHLDITDAEKSFLHIHYTNEWL